VVHPLPHDIASDLLARYPDTVAIETWGETALFYNPGRRLAKGAYFATLKDHDWENDRASELHRPGVFRLNLGLPRAHYFSLFGPTPPRPPKGGVVEGGWDFLTPNRLTPHPVYGWMGWVAILNPSWEMLREMTPLFDAAYGKARRGVRRRG